MSSFTFGPTRNAFDPPKPCSETKTGFGWSPFGYKNPGFDFTPVFGPLGFNPASAPASGTNCTINLATTGSPTFGTTSAPTIGTTVTITPCVGNSSAPTGGNAIAISLNVGAASSPSVGNGITIAPSVGSSVTIAPASGTSITLTQAAGTTITITSNPTTSATSTPGIGGPSTPSSCFPTSTAPASTQGSFGFPTSTTPASTQGGYSFPTSTTPASTQGGFSFPTSTTPASTQGGFGFPTSTTPASTQGGFGFPTSTTPASTQGGFGFLTSTTPASTQGGFGFPTSTTPASTSTFSSSRFGASSPSGKQSFPFGAQPTPIVGNNASRQSASGSDQRRGTRVVPYITSFDAESNGSIKMHSISAMPIHELKCHEELRWEDYQLGDKGGAVPPGGSCKHTSQLFLQKEKHASFCPFGCPLFQTSSSTFNTSTSSPCAERSTSLFAQPRPFAQPSPSPFGPQPSPSPLGAHPSSSPFSAQPCPSPFGSQPSSSPFGAQPCPSPFGSQPSSSPFGPQRSSSTFGPPSSSSFGANFGNSNTFAPSSFWQTSSPNPSSSMHSQVSQPVETSTSLFHSDLTNTGKRNFAIGSINFH